MPNITASQNRSGFATKVDPSVASPIRPLTARDQLTALMDEEKSVMRPRTAPAPRRIAPSAPAQPRGSGGYVTGGDGRGGARLVEPRGPSWQAQQGAAMTPITHPMMGGGYTVDPRKLPPHLRPQQSSFVGPMGSMASAGDDVRAGQAAEADTLSTTLDARRKALLLRGLEDGRFAVEGIG